MFSCCGFGRRRKQGGSGQINDERTPLLDPSSVIPFVPAPQPRIIDDEALLEYQRRIDRIIDEAAEKIINVSTEQPPFVDSGNSSSHTLPQDLSSSSPTPSTSSDPDTGKRKPRLRELTEQEELDDTASWQGERQQERTIDGSVYSLKKVNGQGPAKGSSKNGKARELAPRLDEAGPDDQNGQDSIEMDGEAEEDSGEETATEQGSASRRSSSNAPAGGSKVRPDGKTETRQSSQSSSSKVGRKEERKPSTSSSLSAPKEGRRKPSSQTLHDALALPQADFAKLLTSKPS